MRNTFKEQHFSYVILHFTLKQIHLSLYFKVFLIINATTLFPRWITLLYAQSSRCLYAND